MANEEEVGEEFEEFEEDEIPQLAEDAPWKLIQKNTFTRWVNDHLKTVGRHIDDLEFELADGLNLIYLVEILSGKQFNYINKMPGFRTQKLENVTMVLQFLENEEKIPLINIESADIVDCKLKLIMGLIWALILHYAISIPASGEDRSETARQRLMKWIKTKIPYVGVKNFTTDWNDGRAIGALVDATQPGLCPGWPQFDAKNAVQNCKEAIDAADEWLEIPMLIRPEEMANPHVDENSMMTYLAQYSRAGMVQERKVVIPLQPLKAAVKTVVVETQKAVEENVNAFGPGIESHGSRVGTPARFTIETSSVTVDDVIVLNPQGQREHCDVQVDESRNFTYTCCYIPIMEGEYRVVIKAGNPYRVNVQDQLPDVRRCYATGPGIEPDANNLAGRKTCFEISAKDAGAGNVEVSILDPHGKKETVHQTVTKRDPTTYHVEYVPKVPGPHSVQVNFAGNNIPGSPYNVKIKDPPGDARRCTASGPGIEAFGNVVGKTAWFEVSANGAGTGNIEVLVLDPHGDRDMLSQAISKRDPTTYHVEYVPKQAGHHLVNIFFAGNHIPGSPYPVNVQDVPGDARKCSASGPGIQPVGTMARKNTWFDVSTKDAGSGEVGVIILDPRGSKEFVRPSLSERDKTTYHVEYSPKEHGQYMVSVLFAGNNIPGSPFPVNVKPYGEAGLAFASGRGIQPRGIRVRDAAEFKVHTDLAGEAQLEVQVLGPGGRQVQCFVEKINPNLYHCSYNPTAEGTHTINVTYGGKNDNIQKSPFKVEVGPFKETAIRAYGPGLEGGTCGFSADFTVEANGETGSLSFAIEGPSQVKIDCHDNGNDTADIKYWPTAPGEYAVHILCQGEDIPKSPFMALIKPATKEYDPNRVTAAGPGLNRTGMSVDSYAEFLVDARRGGHGQPAVLCMDQEHNLIDVQIRDNKDGTFTCRYLPKKKGKHTIIISWSGCAIPKSPFRVQVSDPSDPSKVRVYGPGVENGVKAFEATSFTVDCKEAGPGDASVVLANEKGFYVPVQAKDNADSTFTIRYEPQSIGMYTANVRFAGKEIPSSPIRIQVEPKVDVSKILVTGLKTDVFCNALTEFTVDPRAIAKAGESGKVKVLINKPSGGKLGGSIAKNADGTYRVQYKPTEVGPHFVTVIYDGLILQNCPFTVQVSDPGKIRVYGPGIKGGFPNQLQIFTVDARGTGKGGIGILIEGPSKAKMQCNDNKDGTFTVEYFPTEPGTYEVSVKFSDQDVAGSPFHVPIRAVAEPKTIDPRGDSLEVLFTDVSGKRVPAQVGADGGHQPTYFVSMKGGYGIEVKHVLEDNVTRKNQAKEEHEKRLSGRSEPEVDWF